ncbi:MAG TPA: hypothetical protein VHJ20_01115 [Polyangia bacterium]|nr:hypothetical protein [Polyangia bacterium]
MNTAQSLSSFFSDYRSEWEHKQFSSLFVEPTYYAKLLKNRPSLLIGGRGTGKTTALKALRFDALPDRAEGRPGATDCLGIYLRINKNRVSAFQGDELPQSEWGKAFAHYFNLLACGELCRLASWLAAEKRHSSKVLDLGLVVTSLGIQTAAPASPDTLLQALKDAVARLELFVNNPRSVERPAFSVAEAPLKHFAAALADSGLLGSATIFCCLDEYENLTVEQQSIINTYLKHSEPPLTYKIGLRRNGLKTRSTIDDNDLIATPDDYDEIDISSESFDDFARNVAALRLGRARQSGINVSDDPEAFLPELPFKEEAVKLGAAKRADQVRHDLAKHADLANWIAAKSDAELAFIKFWQAGHGGTLEELARDWQANENEWHTRLGNYGVSSLFWLSKGRKGARIRKYYSGLRTFLSLASGNIRYFLELIDVSIGVALDSSAPVPAGAEIVIAPEAQTEAAKSVAKDRLAQIEALGRHGGELRRFALAIGKVFFEFARDPAKAPETNCFVLSGEPDQRERVEGVLSDGVANQVFEVTPATKLTSPSEMRAEEYRLHPIYCPFFEFSHRRKRRATFKAESLLLVLSNPRRAIAALSGKPMSSPPTQTELAKDNADSDEESESDELPAQLAMFADFFYGGSDED